jgi:Transposase DNA-binding
MRDEKSEAKKWAWEEFGKADLGHGSRTSRLARMASKAALEPAGKVSEVFETDADRQGAYGLLESPSVKVEAIVDAIGHACARRCAEHSFVFVPVDGSSVTLTDTTRTKDFGPIGTTGRGARGIKVMDAIAVSPAGVPLGVLALEWWTRALQQGPKCSNGARKVEDKETQRWLDAVTHAYERIASSAPSTKCWFQLDREGDSWPVLHHLAASGHWFTVRSSRDRRLQGSTRTRRRFLRSRLSRAPVAGEMRIDVASGPNRSARSARLVVRFAPVVLELRDPWSKTCRPLAVNAVWVREYGTAPRGEKALDWLLLTNHPVQTMDDAVLVVQGYCQRWRIEDFHRTWKSGACNVEQSQLRAASHLTKWATILAAVAIRVERLKHLARSIPDLPASAELTRHEIRALVLWKRRTKKRTETIPKTEPTVAQATLWIAELGGYTGKSSGGPPGSITIGRGLDKLRQRAAALEELELEGKT